MNVTIGTSTSGRLNFNIKNGKGINFHEYWMAVLHSFVNEKLFD